MSIVSTKYASLGGSAGPLGTPTTEELLQTDDRSHYQHYVDGAIYTTWTPMPSSATEPMSVEVAHEVHGTIFKKWKSLGTDKSVLGLPTTDQRTTGAGSSNFNRFQHGSIYTHHTRNPARPDEPLSIDVANEVHGAIHEKWRSLGFDAGLFAYPTTDERPTGDGAGRYNRFFPDGAIYYSPEIGGANSVHGAIYGKFTELGLDFCGYPTSDETQDGLFPSGRVSRFLRCSIYYSAATGAREVHGAIGKRYQEARSEGSGLPGFDTVGQSLGLPQTDELATPDGVGRFNHFERGSIYYTPATGAWEVVDVIREKWASLGWERGFLGYPLDREGKVLLLEGTRVCPFQGGWIVWGSASGAHEVHGAILDAWRWSDTAAIVGMPISDELPYGADGARVSKFEKGEIYWTPWSGTSVNKAPPPKPGTGTSPPTPAATSPAFPLTLPAVHAGSVDDVPVWTYAARFPPPSLGLSVDRVIGIGAFLTSALSPFEVRFFKYGKSESDWKDASATVLMKNTETLGPDKISLITGGDSKPKYIDLLAMSTSELAPELKLVVTYVKK